MARTPSITDEEILDAAREVFFELGLQAATSEIARRAGISEGTIFRRFPTKQELFLAAMGLPERPPWIDTVAGFDPDSGEASLGENLTLLAHEILDFFEDLIPKTSMIMACGVQQGQPFEGMSEPPPVKGIKALSNYLHSEQRAGRMRPCDPEVVARMYVGTLHGFAFSQWAGVNEFLPMPRPTFVRGVVANLLRGIAPEDD